MRDRTTARPTSGGRREEGPKREDPTRRPQPGKRSAAAVLSSRGRRVEFSRPPMCDSSSALVLVP
jgi:hypothetical protein